MLPVLQVQVRLLQVRLLQVLLHHCCCWAWTYPSRCAVVLKYYVASS